MKRCSDRELVVTVGSIWSQGTSEVHDAIHVRFVGVVAGVVAVGMRVAVRLEDLIGQGQAAEYLRRDHSMSVRPGRLHIRGVRAIQ